jgi:PAT family beta-lactamase induction signal transducer AmpG
LLRVSGGNELQARQTDNVIGALLNRRMLICVMTGLASGMPLYLLIQLVPAWLRAADVSLAEIGLFALVGLPYTWKFLWAPLMDRIALPLGRRRGWMLVAQIGLVLCIGALGYIDPLHETALVAVFASVIAFLSATQDVAIDAYRR